MSALLMLGGFFVGGGGVDRQRQQRGSLAPRLPKLNTGKGRSSFGRTVGRYFNSGISLLTKIRSASSVMEIELLLTNGRNYVNAADGTRTKWKRAADRRKLELVSLTPA